MKQYKPMLAWSAEAPEPERFKEQLQLEKQSEGHKIDQMVVLAHLTQLQFASTIREAGPSDILAHLHLSISESAMEWTTVESRLVPE